MRPVVQIKKTGGNVEVEIIIGQAQFGKYQILLWDVAGKNPREIGHGTNDDLLNDIFPLGPTEIPTRRWDTSEDGSLQ